MILSPAASSSSFMERMSIYHCLEGMISTEMEKVLNAMPAGEKVQAQRVLELNPDHPVFEKLCSLAGDQEKLALYAEILYGQALLIEGVALEDPADFARKVCLVL